MPTIKTAILTPEINGYNIRDFQSSWFFERAVTIFTTLKIQRFSFYTAGLIFSNKCNHQGQLCTYVNSKFVLIFETKVFFAP